jgi:SAM-dependent methyltransferase
MLGVVENLWRACGQSFTIMAAVDALLGTDWAESWRELVERRRAEVGERAASDDPWALRATRFAARPASRPDAFLGFLEPWLEPRRTLIDVGAGTGRHAVPLAARVDWVTAVEPSQGMRERIPHADNMTVIASAWLDAEPAPADLVICVHALYEVPEPVPFIEKLEASARERVFVVLRDAGHPHPAELYAGSRLGREPGLRDCFLLLRQLGVAPDVAMFRYPESHRFDSLDQAAEECRQALGPLWDENEGRAWLARNLRPDEDGTLVHPGAEVTAGVLHWKP